MNTPQSSPGPAKEAHCLSQRVWALSRDQSPQGAQGSPALALGTGNNETLRFFSADFLHNRSHLSFLSVFEVQTMTLPY